MAKKQARQYWLMKSEPDVYSIDSLAAQGRGAWDGVRNYQARNNMRQMRMGDVVLFYHSSTAVPGVVGVARVCREAYPDATQFDPKSDHFDPKSPIDEPRWSMVDVEMVEKFSSVVSLEQLKSAPALSDMLAVQRGCRLSVQPVLPAHARIVLALAGATTRVR